MSHGILGALALVVEVKTLLEADPNLLGSYIFANGLVLPAIREGRVAFSVEPIEVVGLEVVIRHGMRYREQPFLNSESMIEALSEVALIQWGGNVTTNEAVLRLMFADSVDFAQSSVIQPATEALGNQEMCLGTITETFYKIGTETPGKAVDTGRFFNAVGTATGLEVIASQNGGVFLDPGAYSYLLGQTAVEMKLNADGSGVLA
jgi:hypothetical protein